MKKIKFSIILPVYNAEKYLNDCIISVVQQKYQLWELIIIDDGSTDSSAKIYSRYLQDKRIKLIKKANTGVSDSRNKGLEIAEGNYILFIDSDDLFEANALDILVKEIERREQDLYCFDYKTSTKKEINPSKMCTEYGDYCGKESINQILNFSIRQSQWYEKTWYGNLRPVWNKCFKRSIIAENLLQFTSGLKIGEDMVFVLSFLAHSSQVRISNKSFYIYRENDTSVMHTRKWQGTFQGKMYFTAAEREVKERVSESALADLWLETAEADWALLILDKSKINDKYTEFKKMMEDELYQRFCKKNAIEYSSIKQKIYCFLIRKKMILSLMILCYLRAKKHRKISFDLF